MRLESGLSNIQGIDFLSHIRAFDAFGARTASFSDGGIPYLVNEFWTSGQRQAHAIHEVSYRACFKPQLPAFFIAGLTVKGDAVHDPFMGRGTTPIQAALMGRRPVGNDVNTLSVLITRCDRAGRSAGVLPSLDLADLDGAAELVGAAGAVGRP